MCIICYCVSSGSLWYNVLSVMILLVFDSKQYETEAELFSVLRLHSLIYVQIRFINGYLSDIKCTLSPQQAPLSSAVARSQTKCELCGVYM